MQPNDRQAWYYFPNCIREVSGISAVVAKRGKKHAQAEQRTRRKLYAEVCRHVVILIM